MLPRTQGVPAPIDSKHVAVILLSILSGLPPHSSAALVADYAALRPVAGGKALAETLAGFLDKPHDFFELRVDAFAPAAMLSYRGEDHGMQVLTFVATGHHSKPAFDRVSLLSASTLTELALEIAAAEPPKLGRRRTVDRYQRIERAVRY
ncbi:hypothetical protein [Mesorhizobium sp. M1365]|uniref:hypothetical protein n=1 Tax=Mesorhizobium sp. M1365 TaxID=2957090 RepID=UPI00333AC401